MHIGPVVFDDEEEMYNYVLDPEECNHCLKLRHAQDAEDSEDDSTKPAPKCEYHIQLDEYNSKQIIGASSSKRPRGNGASAEGGSADAPTLDASAPLVKKEWDTNAAPIVISSDEEDAAGASIVINSDEEESGVAPSRIRGVRRFPLRIRSS